MALNINLSKRMKIGIGAGVGLLALLVIVGIVVTTGTKKAVAEDGQGALYIDEYGLLLDYDHAAGKLAYTVTKQSNGDSLITVTNAALANKKAGCADKTKNELIGQITVTATLPTGDNAPDSYLQNGDGYLIYNFPGDGSAQSGDACYDAAAADASYAQRTTLYRSFDDLAAAAFNADTTDTSTTTDPAAPTDTTTTTDVTSQQ